MTTETPTTADPAREPNTYPVKDYIDASQLKKDLAYSLTNLSDAMMRQASLFAHYGVLAADASHQVDVIELLLENTEAAVYKLLRDEMATKGEKITEALLEKLVLRHSKVIQMKKALNTAKRIEAIGKIAVESFRHRKDMVVQQGAFAREEMKGEVYTAARSVRDEAQDAVKQNFLERQRQKNAEKAAE